VGRYLGIPRIEPATLDTECVAASIIQQPWGRQHRAAAAASPRLGHPAAMAAGPRASQRHAGGLLTERTRQSLWRVRHGHARHVEAEQPADLFCLDTFYIGKLKDVGKVWHITACDAARRILPELSAAAVAQFLRDVLVPAVARAGWTLRRVLTDGGGEFKTEFDTACAALGIRHTRIRPRHAWTNGFVERLQQTILTEHWRVVFRRHYFTSRASLDRSLRGFMQFYNFDRPHHGYRVRGSTPATVFQGAVAAAR
jgi:transposase InsO family protein